ncbi:MAG: hypothetical protein HY360_01200 [Verrucomicrobia bacterium]|nr:hypothetical protein [Verrucomicrobiota bacterium]
MTAKCSLNLLQNYAARCSCASAKRRLPMDGASQKRRYKVLQAARFITFYFWATTLAFTALAEIDLATAQPLKTQLVSVPVRSSRAWSTALASNSRGGFNFITQFYEYKSAAPVEYVVLDLQTGKCAITEGDSGQYTNSNYQHGNQVRARNGRIFFSELGNVITYYDPADETIKKVGEVADPEMGDKFVFRLEFGPDGMIYGATQAKDLPTVVQIDPDTLKYKVLGQVGKNRVSYSYGYYLAADPPWVYVAVGQTPWELAALNIKTRESKVLKVCAGAGWISLDLKEEGIIAKLISYKDTPEAKQDIFWCADGVIHPFEPNYDPAKLPFKPRSVKPIHSPVVKPPELDLSQLNPDADGAGHVFWRPADSKDAWKDVPFKVKYITPVAIESLIALPNGTLLGNAKQYHGFFSYNPADKKTSFYGAHGPSQGPRTIMNGLVYIAGYPSSVLYRYDPSKPWTSNRLLEESQDAPAELNPLKLGNFRPHTDTHYACFLEPSKNGRLYFGGRRERTGTGGGVGFYDPVKKSFGGHHEGLNFLKPRGMVLMDEQERIIYSGVVQEDPGGTGKMPTEAQLVCYDMELKEAERITIRPKLQNTGALYKVSPTQIIGLVSEKGIYRYDLAQKKCLNWSSLPFEMTGAKAQKQNDRSIWAILGAKTLVRVDPSTCRVDIAGEFDGPVTCMTWVGDDLYAATGGGADNMAGTELHKVILKLPIDSSEPEN